MEHLAIVLIIRPLFLLKIQQRHFAVAAIRAKSMPIVMLVLSVPAPESLARALHVFPPLVPTVSHVARVGADLIFVSYPLHAVIPALLATVWPARHQVPSANSTENVQIFHVPMEITPPLTVRHPSIRRTKRLGYANLDFRVT
jgi:hypothetical protein